MENWIIFDKITDIIVWGSVILLLTWTGNRFRLRYWKPKPGSSKVIINDVSYEIDDDDITVVQRNGVVYVNGKMIFTGEVKSLSIFTPNGNHSLTKS